MLMEYDENAQKRQELHQQVIMANLGDLDKLYIAAAVRASKDDGENPARNRFKRPDDVIEFLKEVNENNEEIREMLIGGGIVSEDTLQTAEQNYRKKFKQAQDDTMALPAPKKQEALNKLERKIDEELKNSINITFNGHKNGDKESFGIQVMSMPDSAAPPSDENKDGTIVTKDAEIPAKPPSGKGRERYELIKEIGRGGMGVVYLLHDNYTGRDVVMKTILEEDWCSDKETRDKMYNEYQLPYFKRESKITMRLVGDSKDLKMPDNERNLAVKVNREISQGHKHIVIMRDYVDQEIEIAGKSLGKDWLKLELVQGETLDNLVLGDKVQKIKDFSRESAHLKERMDWFMKICAGIAYAHEKGVINRDIKPGNMLLDTSENNLAIKKGEATVKIIDWGLAKHQDEKKDAEIGVGSIAKSDQQLLEEAIKKQRLGQEEVVSMQGDIKGTLTYMAPEQAAGRADKLADVYALGAILYEMVTGWHYRIIKDDGRSNEAYARDIALGNIKYRTPREAKPAITLELESIILKATQHKKTNRYQSVADLMRDVKAYLTYNEVEAYKGKYTQGQRDELYRKRNAAAIAAKQRAEAAKKKTFRTLMYSVAGGLMLTAGVGILAYAQKNKSDKYAKNAEERADLSDSEKTKAEEDKRKADADKLAAEQIAAKEKKDREAAEAARIQAEKDKITAETKAAEEKAAREKEEAARKEKRQQAESMVNRGKSLILNKGNLEGAIREFTLAIEKDPDWKEPYYQRGLAQYSRMYSFEAIRDFKDANDKSKVETGKPWAEAVFMGGWVNIDLIERFTEGEVKYPFPSADIFFEELVKAAENDSDLKKTAEVLSAESTLKFFKWNKFEEAYDLAQAVKRDNPEMWQVHYVCSALESNSIIPNIFTRSEMKKYQNNKAGLEDIEKTLSIQRKRFGMELFRARIHRLDLYIQFGETDRAYSEKALVEVRAFKKEWAERSKDKKCEVQNFNVYEAMALRQTGKYEEALGELKMALFYEEKDPQLNNGFSLKPLIQEEKEKSQKLFEQYKKQKPKGK